MDPAEQDQLREWLQAVLSRDDRSRAELSRVLRIHRSGVTKIFSGGRSITVDDVKKIVSAWNVAPPDCFSWIGKAHSSELTKTNDPGGVPVRGRIAERAWVVEPPDGEVTSLPRVGAMLHSAYPVADQSAYQIDAQGLPGEIYQPGDIVIVVPFATYRVRPKPGDLVVIRRREGDRTSYGLRKAVQRGRDIAYLPVLQGSRDDRTFEPFGWVISFQRHLV